MKYIMYGELKEPVEESFKKIVEIESERQKKGETWSASGEL